MSFESKLNGEYLDVYNDIVDEIKVEELSGEFTKEVKNDVLEMLLSAQADGVAAMSVIGQDVREFVKTIRVDFNKRTNWMYKIGTTLSIIFMLLGLEGISNFYGGATRITYNTVMFISICLITNYLGTVISRKYRVTKTRSGSKYTFDFGILFAMVIISRIITDSFTFDTIVQIEAGVAYIAIVFVLCFLSIVASEWITKNK